MIQHLFLLMFLFHDSPTGKVLSTVPAVKEQAVSFYVLIVLWTILLLAGIGLVLYITEQALKHFSVFQQIKKFFKKNYFLILVAFPFFYLIYYYIYYLPNRGGGESLWMAEETANMLWTISITFLGTGVATGALKWFNNLAFFKKQFSEIIQSKEFSEVLNKKMMILALSDDYLLERNDLDKIWKRVTSCKYKQEFPQLYEKIESKLENELFKTSNISYYYKNFQIGYHISLHKAGYVKIVERSSFTIIRPSREKFLFDFSTMYNNSDPETKVELVFSSKNALEIDFAQMDTQKVPVKEKTTINCSKYLEGHMEYHIESEVIHIQSLAHDRSFVFGGRRIIDDLTINIERETDINFTFEALNDNKFYPNGAQEAHKTSFINRDVLLPGPKFIMFFYV